MSTQIDLLVSQARAHFRTIGPAQLDSTGNRSDNLAVRVCHRCNPPVKAPMCPACNAAFPERWQLRLHLRIDPETCQRTRDRKARAWASRV